MKGWKTFALNLSILIVGAGTAALADAPIDPKTAGIVASVLGGLNMVLRYLTTTPIFSAEPE